MRIRRWIPAIVAGLMVIFGGCVAATAASNPAAARPLTGSFRLVSATADSDPTICSYAPGTAVNGECIVAAGSGQQVYVTKSGLPGFTFEYTNDELQDTVTGLCLKDDPNVGNIVVELACTTSGSTGEKEEWTKTGVDDNKYYVFENYYAIDNGLTGALFLHVDTSDGDVNCYKDTSGSEWSF
jgi:hypothetical protein